jgi:hypothetical protein
MATKKVPVKAPATKKVAAKAPPAKKATRASTTAKTSTGDGGKGGPSDIFSNKKQSG